MKLKPYQRFFKEEAWMPDNQPQSTFNLGECESCVEDCNCKECVIQENCVCNECEQKNECVSLQEVDVNKKNAQCHAQGGKKYSTSADMCYMPCQAGNIFSPKEKKCIPMAK